ncbi:hypothetical protein B7P43_G04287 [Cryptotermes secundus]|uniref:Uncharacterized protein n=1 Tax=Cryptotermes secundus TaxID=105785 RepID=A0A2J7QFZ7_9NEOP|nr:hypothetical protein B7P43_G04287 [Cryptotermes secundus]
MESKNIHKETLPVMFPDDEAVEREVTAWFRQQPKGFYAGFQGLAKRWDKCLNVQGDIKKDYDTTCHPVLLCNYLN